MFAANQLKDIMEDAKEANSFLQNRRLNSQKLLEKVGVWSAPVKQVGNKFLSRKDKVPEVADLIAAAGEGPLPQKLAWEAASQQKLGPKCPSRFRACFSGLKITWFMFGMLKQKRMDDLICLGTGKPVL